MVDVNDADVNEDDDYGGGGGGDGGNENENENVLHRVGHVGHVGRQWCQRHHHHCFVSEQLNVFVHRHLAVHVDPLYETDGDYGCDHS